MAIAEEEPKGTRFAMTKEEFFASCKGILPEQVERDWKSEEANMRLSSGIMNGHRRRRTHVRLLEKSFLGF